MSSDPDHAHAPEGIAKFWASISVMYTLSVYSRV